MFETSQDLFYIVLAFCILWFTVFLCWALYYLIRMLKQTNEVMTEIREKLETLSNVVNIVKSKLFEKGVNGLMSFVAGVATKKKTKKPKTKSKK